MLRYKRRSSAFSTRVRRTPRRTVKDDIRADFPIGTEVDFVSGFVRRLFWTLRRAGVAEDLCARATLQRASQDGRGNRPAVWQSASHVATLPGIDQVGRRETAGPLPADRGTRARASQRHWVRGRVRRHEERRRDRRRGAAVQRQPWQDRQLCRGSASQLFRSRFSGVAGQQRVPAGGLGE